MDELRSIKKIITARKTIEGAGVHLKRVIGFDDPYQYDPFLLLDDFRSNTPSEYQKGFPWHPHRGIETITYMLKGSVEHQDSMGNKGVIGAGDIQWMTAGGGIYHQEMPVGDDTGKMYGFQLWANLPKRDKLIDPKYRGFTAEEIPEIKNSDGVVIKVIAGKILEVEGPVKDVVIQPEYYDIYIPENTDYIHKTRIGNTVLVYIFDGEGYVDTIDVNNTKQKIENHNLILFSDGKAIRIRTKESGLRFLFISGKPIHETIAWYGPIVMNTEEELQTAYNELENGTFIKAKKT